MIEYNEFHELERNSSRPKKFLKHLEAYVQEHGLKAIQLLRSSGICVDIFNTGKNKELFESCIAILNKSQNISDKYEVERLVNEVEILNNLFQDFNTFRKLSGVEDIHVKRQIPAFLIATEIMIGSGWEFMQGRSLIDIKSRYLYVFGAGDSNGNPISVTKVGDQFSRALDNCMEHTGLILKYFIHNSVPFDGIKITVSSEEVRKSREHLNFADKYEKLYDLYDLWKFFNWKVSSTNSHVYFEPIEEKHYLSQQISNSRFKLLKLKWNMDFITVSEAIKTDPITELLPPNKWRTVTESSTGIFCHEFFGSDDFSEQVNGVSLGEWIRAYTVLSQEGNRYLDNRKNVMPLSIEKWCIVKTREEWIELITKGGINSSKAERIIESFTFGSNSRDLLDCPLLPISNYLIALPSIIAHIDPTGAMLSNFNSKNSDIAFKGDGLERRIKDRLTKSGIKCASLEAIEGSDQYQCDVTFNLDDDLYFMECKTFLQPLAAREHYELSGKIESAIKQLNRISDFFSSNLQFVRESLKLNENWEPKNIHKVVLCSSMLGEAIHYDGSYVIDESALRRFLDREAPGMAIGKTRIRPKDINYEGDITSEKLINILKELPQIKLLNKYFSGQFSEMRFNEFNIEYFFYKHHVDSYIQLDENQIYELSEKLGVDKIL